jgi:hypothetical protein
MTGDGFKDRGSPLTTTDPLYKLLTPEIARRIAIDYWGSTFDLEIDKRDFQIHLGRHKTSAGDIVIVVADNIIGKRHEWHFGTFTENPGDSLETFVQKVEDVCKPKHIVDGYTLQSRILDVIYRK